MEMKALARRASGVVAVGLFTAFVVMACGSEPKPEPAAATATASAEPPPAPAASSAAPAASASAAPETPAVDPKIAECDKLRDDANQTLDAKRIEVDKDCKKDADCVPIKGRACGFDCVNAAIPKSLEKEWNTAVTKVKDGQCKKWDSNECSKSKTRPQPTCQDKKVACDKGRCILK
jgi:hypothetical protein